jgi:hypothetical protein
MLYFNLAPVAMTLTLPLQQKYQFILHFNYIPPNIASIWLYPAMDFIQEKLLLFQKRL